MDSFPLDFTPDKIFPKPSADPHLAEIRKYIYDTLKTATTRFGLQQVYINLRSNRRDPGMTFRYISKLDEELSNLGFHITYHMEKTIPGVNGSLGMTTNIIVKFEDIDPFGTMPLNMIIGPKNNE